MSNSHHVCQAQPSTSERQQWEASEQLSETVKALSERESLIRQLRTQNDKLQVHITNLRNQHHMQMAQLLKEPANVQNQQLEILTLRNELAKMRQAAAASESVCNARLEDMPPLAKKLKLEQYHLTELVRTYQQKSDRDDANIVSLTAKLATRDNELLCTRRKLKRKRTTRIARAAELVKKATTPDPPTPTPTNTQPPPPPPPIPFQPQAIRVDSLTPYDTADTLFGMVDMLQDTS
jgi:hypothetical protein